MCHRLRNGRVRKTRAPLSGGVEVRPFFTIHSWISPFDTIHLWDISYRVARDPRFERLSCSHTGTYADDCLVQRVTSHRCYIVATCDRELRRRIRKVPGVPLMYIVKRRYAIERLPDQGAPV